MSHRIQKRDEGTVISTQGQVTVTITPCSELFLTLEMLHSNGRSLLSTLSLFMLLTCLSLVIIASKRPAAISYICCTSSSLFACLFLSTSPPFFLTTFSFFFLFSICFLLRVACISDSSVSLVALVSGGHEFHEKDSPGCWGVQRTGWRSGLSGEAHNCFCTTVPCSPNHRPHRGACAHEVQ